MISHLAIENFKSIQSLNLPCRKINIFLGEPNTGKSNILEALGMLSWAGQSAHPPLDHPSPNSRSFSGSAHPQDECASAEKETTRLRELSAFVRFEKIHNLFFKTRIREPVSITIESDRMLQALQLSLSGEGCTVTSHRGSNPQELWKKSDGIEIAELDFSGNIIRDMRESGSFRAIFYYRFEDIGHFPDPSPSPLKSPIGQNLFSVVMADKTCLSIMKDLFSSPDFRFVLKPGENKFEFQQEEDSIVYTYPYLTTSDTFRRIAFYAIAITSQLNATLIFEEPESHTFPYYTKYLAELIGSDVTNQFFIVTHNNYLLSTLIEKVQKDHLAVHAVYQQNGETKVKSLTSEQISDCICTDPFFDLESFLEHDA